MALIVQKYGGSSVADAEKIKNVARRIIKTKQAGNQVVVVVINNEQKSITATVSGVPVEFTKVSQYETSAENNLAEVSAGNVPSAVTFPAESVTTLVFTVK